MNLFILIAVILYEAISIAVVSIILSRRRHQAVEGEFTTAGNSLGPALSGITMALMFLGGAHIWGMTENTWMIGANAMWFGVGCIVVIVVVCLITGPWFRKIGVSTTTEIFSKLFGEKSKIVVAAVTAILQIGILSLETQSVAITINLLTGWPYFAGAVIAGLVGICYVVLAGMKEISWLNVINAIVMYAALIIAVIVLGYTLPGSWEGVTDYYVATDSAGMLDMLADKSYILTFFIPSALGISMFHGVSQAGVAPALAAKDIKTVKRAIWWAVPVNGLFCVFTCAIGLAAKSTFPDSAIPMMAAPQLIVEYLPPAVIWLLAACFLGALLSTFSLLALSAATLVTKDIVYMGRQNVPDKQQNKTIRLIIVVVGIVAIAVSTFQPAITDAINWIFSWGVPIFVMIVIGLWWKRVTMAMWTTFIVAWVLNCLWTMTPLPAAVGLPGLSNIYITCIVSVILGVVLTAAGKGEIGYFRAKKQQA